jgi:hypothetical protein
MAAAASAAAVAAADAEAEEEAEMARMFNNGEMDEEQEAEELMDLNLSPEELRQLELKRAIEEEDRRQRAEAEAAEEERKEAHSNLQDAINEANRKRESLVAENKELMKQLAPLLQKSEGAAAAAERKEEKPSLPESEKRFTDALAAMSEGQEQLRRVRAQYDRVAIDLQGRLDEKEFKANEIHESFRDFKREIARSAENSRTGKPIPKRIIGQFEGAEMKKDQDVERVRLKNINLRMMLRKLENSLRAKEQLAEGLHLIDFEQLKIENQTLNEKIEERNEELHKLRKKTTTTVQVLTHIKEKLQFVQVENQVLKHDLAALDSQLTSERDTLTKAKRERDGLRQENATLRQRQGFVNSDLLVTDFEQRKVDMQSLRDRLSELQERHNMLHSQIDAHSMVPMSRGLSTR